MYIALCDDQPEELEALQALLHRWEAEHGTVLRCRTFHSAAELVDAAQREPFSLYFLDVVMPGMDGMAAAREIRSFDDAAELVFLTSAPSYAYESYSVRALNYLLKPIQAEQLFPILDRLYHREQKPREGLTLKCGSTLIRILFSQLTYVEVYGKHLYFNLTDGTTKEVAGTLKEYEQRLLQRPEFMRVHRAYIVNMFQVEQLSPAGVITFSGKNLPVSRLLYSQLQKDYMQLLFAQEE